MLNYIFVEDCKLKIIRNIQNMQLFEDLGEDIDVEKN